MPWCSQAARARELGLEARAKKIDREHRGALSRSISSLLRSSEAQIELVARIGGDLEESGGTRETSVQGLGLSQTLVAIIKSTIGPAILFSELRC